MDSEHSAILQCIAGRPTAEVRRRRHHRVRRTVPSLDEQSSSRTPRWRTRLQHPTWRMGRKITVDSATLANKALEVIEAHFLFGLPYDRIEVVVHPQSVVHSFVEFVDGSVLAQLGVPSMELPVLYALTHPDRVADTGVPPFDPVELSPLTFEPGASPGLSGAASSASQAGRIGGAAPAVFNAANEQAVALFLEGAIRFADIPRAIERALGRYSSAPAGSREAILDADAAARRHVQELFRMLASRRSDSRLRARDLRARARPFHGGEADGRVRAALLHRLRTRAVPQAAGRDRVRARGAAARRIRAHGVAGTTPRRPCSRAATRTAHARARRPGYDPNAMKPFGPKPIPEHRWFESKTPVRSARSS